MKKIIKSIACICLTLAVAIGSCFGAMKLSKNQRFLGTSYNKASAYVFTNQDNVLTFTSDTFFAQRIPTSSSGESQPTAPENNNKYFANYSFQFSRYSNVLELSVDVLYVNASTGNSNSTNGYQEFYSAQTRTSGSLDTTMQAHYPVFITSNTNTGFPVYTTNYLIDINFIGFTIADYTNYGLGVPDGFSVTNYIVYTFFNADGDYISIFVCYQGITKTSNPFIYSNTGTYYFNQDGQFNNNSYYNQGFNDGYVDGVENGNTEGYNRGYNQGRIEGFNNGYTEGLESSERLGFPALITSVIDVPVKVFTSLFNFDILGVNILTFITSLLTIALILAIVRKVKSD